MSKRAQEAGPATRFRAYTTSECPEPYRLSALIFAVSRPSPEGQHAPKKTKPRCPHVGVPGLLGGYPQLVSAPAGRVGRGAMCANGPPSMPAPPVGNRFLGPRVAVANYTQFRVVALARKPRLLEAIAARTRCALPSAPVRSPRRPCLRRRRHSSCSRASHQRPGVELSQGGSRSVNTPRVSE